MGTAGVGPEPSDTSFSTSDQEVTVLYTLLEFLTWLQPEATGGGGGGGGGGGEGGMAPTGGCATQAGLLLVMMLIFYFMLIRPQQKRQKEHDAMLKALRKGAIVRTSGGIRGEIFELNDRDATLLVHDKTKLNVLRSNIAGVEPDPSEQKKDGDKDKKD